MGRICYYSNIANWDISKITNREVLINGKCIIKRNL